MALMSGDDARGLTQKTKKEKKEKRHLLKTARLERKRSSVSPRKPQKSQMYSSTDTLIVTDSTPLASSSRENKV